MIGKGSLTGFQGELVAHVIKKNELRMRSKIIPHLDLSMRDLLLLSTPFGKKERWLMEWQHRNFGNIWRGLARLAALRFVTKRLGGFYATGTLWLKKQEGAGKTLDFGLVSLDLVTVTFRDHVIDALDGGANFANYDFHGIGTGTTAAANTDTALQTELTTEYNPNSTRATGTPTQPSANVYQTLATNTLDSGTPAVTEHGVLTQAATGGGNLLDRHVFTAINLDGTAGDALQSTYQLTVAAET